MSKVEIHMNSFRRVLKECKPKLSLSSSGQLTHNQCILHKYLERTTVGRSLNFAGCLGGPICNEIKRKLGLDNRSSCAAIHEEVYNFIKKNYRGAVKI